MNEIVSKIEEYVDKYMIMNGFDDRSSRLSGVVRLKHCIIYMLREDFIISFPEIGKIIFKIFGTSLDHSSIFYAYNKIKDNITIEREFVNDISNYVISQTQYDEDKLQLSAENIRLKEERKELLDKIERYQRINKTLNNTIRIKNNKIAFLKNS